MERSVLCRQNRQLYLWVFFSVFSEEIIAGIAVTVKDIAAVEIKKKINGQTSVLS